MISTRFAITYGAACMLALGLVICSSRSSPRDPRALVAARKPLVAVAGQTEQIADTDYASIPGGLSLNGTASSGAGDAEATSCNLVGNSNQFSITGTVANSVKYREITNGASILDFDPVASTGTEAIQYRFFRHTVTSGGVSVAISNGNTATTNINFNPNGHSAMRGGLYLNTTPTDSPDGAFSGTVDILNNLTGQTTNYVALQINNPTPTYDTTAGALTTFGARINAGGTRSAGANPLTGIGLWVNTGGAQFNYAIKSVAGYVATAQSFADESATATTILNGVCASPNCGNTFGRVTANGAVTSVSIGFSTAFLRASTGLAVVPACVASSEGVTGLALGVTPSSTALVVTSASLAGVTFDYHCGGF